MSRSEQARFLASMAADHATADRLGMPVDEYRGLRAEAQADPEGPSRRALLGRAAALGLMVAAGGAANLAKPSKARATSATPSTTPARIAIIGAGIAGLNAALTLADKGISSTIYEANPSRIGGRMYSQGSPANPGFWDQGQVSEYGGELIDQQQTTIMQLAQRFKLPLVSVRHVYGSQADQVLWFQGGYYPRSQADSDFKPVYSAIQADMQASKNAIPTYNNYNAAQQALDNMSIVDWINTRVPGGESSKLGAFLDVGYNVEYGADCQNQSTWDLLGLLAYQTDPSHFNIWGISNERYHVIGGNDQIPHAIADYLPAGTVQMGMQLVAIAANADNTQTLTFQVNGGATKTVIADHTIIAVPFPILSQHIDLSKANFDPMMQGVLTHMKMGYCTKLNMQFTGRPWVGTGPWPGVSDGEAFSDMSFQQVWDVTRGQNGTDGILVQYHGGTLAYGVKPGAPFTDATNTYTNNLVASNLAQVEKLFPGTTAMWNGKALQSAWHLNPYSYGAYVYWPVGYLTTYAGYEGTAQANGRIHISGEHTSFNFQGYMNGGAQEGARAANEVLSALGL